MNPNIPNDDSETERPVVSSRRRRLIKVLLGMAGIGLVSAISGFAYETWAARRTLQLHPMPGQAVDIGTHRLHVRCFGQGSPVVLFDAGAGGTSLDWHKIQQELASETRVCAYDRAGLGWSEAGPNPRSSEQIVDELQSLLSNAKIEPPYLLVGHSFGGLNMQLFAAKYPQQVAGLVLIDSVHPEHYSKMPQQLRGAAESQLSMLRVGRLLAPFGLPRLLFPPVASPRLTPDLQSVANARGYGRNVYSTLYEEAASFDLSSKQVLKSTFDHDGLLLTVLSRTTEERWPAEISAEKAEQAWRELQVDLAGQVSGSTHLIVENAGHFIHLDQPSVVVDAIRQQLTAARQPNPSQD